MTDEQPPDRALAARLVAEQFPQWADLPVSDVALSGWDNRTFRLGSELSIRLPRSRFYREQVAKEQHWLPRLSPYLPVAIPRPVAQGAPGQGYPYDWSVYAWIDGEPATLDRIGEPSDFAIAVAEFLVALRGCDPVGGPGPGQHNWWRGGPLDHYLDEARTALDTVSDELTTPRWRRRARSWTRRWPVAGPDHRSGCTATSRTEICWSATVGWRR